MSDSEPKSKSPIYLNFAKRMPASIRSNEMRTIGRKGASEGAFDHLVLFLIEELGVDFHTAHGRVAEVVNMIRYFMRPSIESLRRPNVQMELTASRSPRKSVCDLKIIIGLALEQNVELATAKQLARCLFKLGLSNHDDGRAVGDALGYHRGGLGLLSYRVAGATWYCLQLEDSPIKEVD